MPATIRKIDLSGFDRATRRLLRASNDLRPVLRAHRRAFRRDQREHMKTQTSGDGAQWDRLAPSTREKRISRGGRAGKFTKRGKLRKSARRRLNRVLSARLIVGAKIKVQRKGMRFTSPVPWAGVHQSGGVGGKGVRIPAREFLWVSDPFMESLSQAIATMLTNEFMKKRRGIREFTG